MTIFFYNDIKCKEKVKTLKKIWVPSGTLIFLQVYFLLTFNIIVVVVVSSLFFSNNIYLILKCQTAWWEKKWRGWGNFGRIKFSSSLCASKMSATYKPVTLNCSCWCHIINILLTELSRCVWENLDLGRVYRPHCIWSVLTTSVKIFPYRPPAQLIRAKSQTAVVICVYYMYVVQSQHTFKGTMVCSCSNKLWGQVPSCELTMSASKSSRRDHIFGPHD